MADMPKKRRVTITIGFDYIEPSHPESDFENDGPVERMFENLRENCGVPDSLAEMKANMDDSHLDEEEWHGIHYTPGIHNVTIDKIESEIK